MKRTPLQVAIDHAGVSGPSDRTRQELAVAIAYAKAQTTMKGVSEALGITDSQVTNRVYALLRTAVKMGWLIEPK